ncbi:MAG: hypothetical protein HQ481_14385 [Alphaproteobacteria bacterium]|nr:hypothetical protein [Alphaproteobacteria bacterium]
MAAAAEIETPEDHLAQAEVELAELEAAHAALRDKIAGLTAAPSMRSLSPADFDRVAPAAYERAKPYFNFPEHRAFHEMEDALVEEPKLRARLVDQRGRVELLRQSARSREVLTLKKEYFTAAQRIGDALTELNSAILQEAEIRNRVQNTGVLVSPLPDLSFVVIGTKDELHSPMAGWFRRAKQAGVLENNQ